MDISVTQDIADDLAFRVAIRQSEIRYRRLFEAAHDGVLILDSVSRKITDANPFMSHLLGYRHEELLGKELWEIGLLKDELASQAAFRELQKSGQVRYEDLPLES
jgi:PAS domain S-box-containing protein